MLSVLSKYLTYMFGTQWILPSYLINEFESKRFSKKISRLDLVCELDRLILINSEREALQLPISKIEKITGEEEKDHFKFKIHLCSSQ